MFLSTIGNTLAIKSINKSLLRVDFILSLMIYIALENLQTILILMNRNYQSSAQTFIDSEWKILIEDVN